MFIVDKTEEDGMGDVDDEASESESEEEDAVLTGPSKNSIYNRDGLLEKLGDTSWPDNVEWIHKFYIGIDQEQEIDVNDDLAPELAFYTQALEGTWLAFERLHSMGLLFLRPSDYYVEIVETDSRMEKVKIRLKIEEAGERRKARESKSKYS
uniref:Uncharacterized protein n=1 Tax=Nelumbo nucifera TaxID=4432 RepID=A0A822XFJ3_NELNU|nr:TPA_asm: hypothetical protein HUJ06_020135 [Nelumbo nucifera]